MDLPAESIPYLIGIGSGVFAFVSATLVLSVPPSFGPFALRSLAVMLVASLAAFLVSDRYFGPGHRRDGPDSARGRDE